MLFKSSAQAADQTMQKYKSYHIIRGVLACNLFCCIDKCSLHEGNRSNIGEDRTLAWSCYRDHGMHCKRGGRDGRRRLRICWRKSREGEFGFSTAGVQIQTLDTSVSQYTRSKLKKNISDQPIPKLQSSYSYRTTPCMPGSCQACEVPIRAACQSRHSCVTLCATVVLCCVTTLL